MSDPKTVVLCIDRDDDLGRKTGIESPVVGREDNLEAAKELALADPEDADANTIFEAVRSYDRLVEDGRDPEVVTITGDYEVGVRSDSKISDQLDEVFGDIDRARIILVTDGVQDEHVIPIVESRGEITSVRRVVMKQSERLEGMYQMVHDFVDRPEMSKIFLGAPAIAFLLVAIFGTAGWRLVIGGLGLYLLVKGFKMETRVTSIYEEVTSSLATRRLSFIFYVASVFIALVGLKGGADYIRVVGPVNILESAGAFIQGSVFFLFIGFIVALLGRLISLGRQRQRLAKYLTFASMGLAVSVVAFETSTLILTPETGFVRLLASLAFGLFIVGVAKLVERVV